MYFTLLTFVTCIAISSQGPPIFAVEHFGNEANSSKGLILNNSNDTEDNIVDYYWRDYYGVIPRDALPAGIDKAGKLTYVGQVMILNGGLLPATIYQGNRSAFTAYNGKPYISEDLVKILCSRSIDKFQWLVTKSDDVQLLTNCHLVIGGSQDGYLANIGRANHEMETVVGKAFGVPPVLKGLTLPTKKGGDAKYLQYEVLTYNCNYRHGNTTFM